MLACTLPHVLQAPRAAAYVPLHAGRIAEDQGVRRDVTGHDRACAHQGELADGDAADDDRATAKRRAVAHARRRHLPIGSALEPAVQGDGPREPIVGEAHVWPDEDAVVEGDSFKDRDMVLDLDARADGDMRVNIDAFADIALLADLRVLEHMGLTPDTRPGDLARHWRDIDSAMSIERRRHP